MNNEPKKIIDSISINGINVFPFKCADQLIDHALKEKKILVALHAQKFIDAPDQLKELANNNVGYCDGIGAVLLLKRKGVSAIRIPGCELWLKIIEKYYHEKSFYLIGGKENIIAKVVGKLHVEFPGLKIVGARSGYFNSDNEISETIKDVANKKPDVVFVAMGTPKQENFMEELQKHHSALYQGLGGSFDVYSGSVKRSPKILNVLGLEWFYRWSTNPFKMTKRTLSLLPFIYKLVFDKM
ncbi:WecB/TagA/CpsF family glycosyltransferase [Planctomycetota bacterium]